MPRGRGGAPREGRSAAARAQPYGAPLRADGEQQPCPALRAPRSLRAPRVPPARRHGFVAQQHQRTPPHCKSSSGPVSDPSSKTLAWVPCKTQTHSPVPISPNSKGSNLALPPSLGVMLVGKQNEALTQE